MSKGSPIVICTLIKGGLDLRGQFLYPEREQKISQRITLYHIHNEILFQRSTRLIPSEIEQQRIG